MRWQSMFSLGIMHPQLFPITIQDETTILDSLQLLIEDKFFDTFEVTSIGSSKIRNDVKSLLEQNGIRIVYSCAPPILGSKINLNALDPGERAVGVERIINYLQEAIFLGAEIFTVLSGPYPGADKSTEAKAALIQSLKEICRYGQDNSSKLTITLETFDRNIDKKCLVGPTSEAVKIAEEIRLAGYNNFGLTLDQGHLPLLDEEPDYAINKAVHYLHHIHLGNCVKLDREHPLYGDQHPRFGLEGCHLVDSDLAAFLAVLKGQGFFRKPADGSVKPVLSFEVKPGLGESSLQTLVETKNTWLRAWEEFCRNDN